MDAGSLVNVLQRAGSLPEPVLGRVATQVSFMGDAKSSLGDAESSLGDATSSLGDGAGKALGQLAGHGASILELRMNEKDHQLISLAADKVRRYASTGQKSAWW